MVINSSIPTNAQFLSSTPTQPQFTDLSTNNTPTTAQAVGNFLVLTTLNNTITI